MPLSDTFRYLMGSNGAIGLGEYSIPNMYGSSNKLYEFIATNIPAAYSDHPNSRGPIAKAHFISINNNRPKTIYKSILNLKEADSSLYKNNISLIEDYYNWEQSCHKLVQLYDQIFHVSR